MEAHAGDGFEAFLQTLQMDFATSPASSDISSNSVHVSSHPPLPQSRSFSQTKYKGHQPPSPTCSGPFETLRGFGKPPSFSSNVGYVVEKPPQRGTHRRAHSEIAFRLPDQLMVDQDPVPDNAESSGFSDETGEDLLSAYLEMESSRDGLAHSATSSGFGHAQGSPIDDVLADYDSIRSAQDAKEGNRNPAHFRPPRHHHSASMDSSLSLTEDFLMSDLDFLETKKAMDMDQLAELSVTDPRRAKRILANRQSAARSKERKLKYIAELEQKIQKLQTEANSLLSQVSTLQRDTKGLSTQNSELKLRLQAMEQQAHLRDALNEALKEEVRWLKSASGFGNGHVFAVDTRHQASTQPF